MEKMITENGVKPIVYCKLKQFYFHNPQLCTAFIVRTSPHPKLGSAKGGLTVTSQVLVINFQRKFFETQNTVYRWA